MGEKWTAGVSGLWRLLRFHDLGLQIVFSWGFRDFPFQIAKGIYPNTIVESQRLQHRTSTSTEVSFKVVKSVKEEWRTAVPNLVVLAQDECESRTVTRPPDAR